MFTTPGFEIYIRVWNESVRGIVQVGGVDSVSLLAKNLIPPAKDARGVEALSLEDDLLDRLRPVGTFPAK